MLSLAILLSLGFAAIFAVSRRSGKRISAAHSNRLRHTTVVGALVVAIVALLAVGAPEADSLQRIARLRLSATTCDHAQMGFAAKLPASKFDEKWPSEAQLGLEPGVSKKVEWALGTSPSSWQHEYDAHPRVTTAAQFVATNTVGAVDTGINKIYTSVDPVTGEIQYVGRTNDIARRGAEHLSGKGIQIQEVPGLGKLERRRCSVC